MLQEKIAALEGPTQNRIIEGALRCFDEVGIAKTTIENIASEAGVTRPTVYKYFAGKEAILEEIARRETVKVRSEVRKQLERNTGFAAQTTDVLFLSIRIASANPYILRLVESHEFQLASLKPTGLLFQMQRAWWEPALMQAASSGELANDFDLDEAVIWLHHSQSQLMLQAQNPDVGDAFLRRFIRRFIVHPLLANAEGESLSA